MVTLLWVIAGLYGGYLWLRGNWYVVLVAALVLAAGGFLLADQSYIDARAPWDGNRFIVVLSIAAVGAFIGGAPWWIRKTIAAYRAEHVKSRDATFESFGSRILTSMGAPPMPRRD